MEPRDISATNKAGWEEAFDRRRPDWDAGRIERLRSERFAFVEPLLAAALDAHGLAGRAVGQFCCNDGRELLSVVQAGAASGVGFDIADNMVDYARRCAEVLGAPCRFVAGDVLAIGEEWRDAFDVALVTIGALTWFESPTTFFAKAASCLKPGGRLFLSDMHPATNLFAAPGEEGYDAERPDRVAASYFRSEPFVESTGIGYLSGRYESKPLVSFFYTFADLVAALEANGLVLRALQESERDLSGLFGHLQDRGIPLSYLAVAERR